MNRRSARGALGSSAIGFVGRARPLFMSGADRDRAISAVSDQVPGG
jgi:hypothetical protein